MTDLASSLGLRFAVVATFALTLGLLHLLLFAFENRDRRNLFFALLAGAFALVVMLDYRERIGAEVLLPIIGPIQRWAVSLLILSAVRFSYSLFRSTAPRRYWAYVVTILALLLLALVDRRFFDGPAGILGLVVTIDALLTVIQGWRRLQSEAWIVALGAGLFSLGGIAQMAVDLVGAGRVGDLLAPYLWGGLALLVASSIYLARTFASTRRELEQRLVEVEELSQRALEQERMARDEEVRRRLVEAENERRREELESARRLQVAMLPETLPTIDGYEIAASMITATEVGGDYYDATTAEDGSLWLAVGDAVGHGARAGTLVAVMKSLFTGVTAYSDPVEALTHFDSVLRGMGLRRAHLALTLARLIDGVLEIASAGMPPTLVRRMGGEVEEVTFASLPLGSPLRQRYELRKVSLAPGDVALLLSDGLIELPGEQGPLGYDAVREAVAGAPDPRRPLDRWLTSVVGSLMDDAPPPDDVTALVLQAAR